MGRHKLNKNKTRRSRRFNSINRSNSLRNISKYRKSRRRRIGGCSSVSCENAGSKYSTSGTWTSKGGSERGFDQYNYIMDSSPYNIS